MKENILNIRNQLLRHEGRADRYHTAWSLLETCSNAITVVFLLLTLALILAVLLTGHPFLTIPVWFGACVAWLVVQFLIELAIEAVRTRQRTHELEASHCKLELENMGLDPNLF